MSKAVICFGLMLVALPALAWDKMEGVGKASAKGVITITAEWVKNKKDKYDVSFKLNSEAKHTILIFAGDMKCARGKETGGMVDIHSDRRTIELRAGEIRQLLTTCRLQNREPGDFEVTFKVFDNPSGDSNTPGKVLAEKLVWKQGEKEGKVL